MADEQADTNVIAQVCGCFSLIMRNDLRRWLLITRACTAVQFVSTEGEEVGPRVNLPLSATPEQLIELLNELLNNVRAQL